MGGLDLRQLEGDEVELALTGTGALAQLGQRCLERAHPPIRGPERGPAREVLRATETVEHLQLRGGEHQLAVLVLAVERQQRHGHLAQVGHRRRAPVEVRARPALGAHPPREDHLVGIGGQPLAQLAP
jgi:hypothetical protein